MSGYLYVFFRPGVEHGGNVASIMDGDEESSVKNDDEESAFLVLQSSVFINEVHAMIKNIQQVAAA